MKRTIIAVSLLLAVGLCCGCNTGKEEVMKDSTKMEAHPVQTIPVAQTQPPTTEAAAADAEAETHPVQPLDEGTVNTVVFLITHQTTSKVQIQRWLQRQKFAVLDCDGGSKDRELGGEGEIERCDSGGFEFQIDEATGKLGTLEITAEPKSLQNWYEGLAPALKDIALVEHQKDPIDPFDSTGQRRLLVETYKWTSIHHTPCAFKSSKGPCSKWMLQLIESHERDKPQTLTVFFTDGIELNADARRLGNKLFKHVNAQR